MNKKPILSICIPTWNRAEYLQIGLKKLSEQLAEIDSNEIEIFISDNCSNDNTMQIVKNYIEQGLPILYNRNNENLGMDGNFNCCYKYSTGNFLWLMGDDDFLLKGALKKILDILRNNSNIGVLHLKNSIAKEESTYRTFNNYIEFFKEVSYDTTFITGNIFNTNIKNEIKDPEKNIGSYFFFLPLIIISAIKNNTNIIDYSKILECGHDSKSNGGYNFFKVFVQNYLDIWKTCLSEYKAPKSIFKFIKKDIYINFHQYFINDLLIKKRNILKDNLPRNGRKGFYIEDAWKILIKYYGCEWYFIPYLISWQIKYYFTALRNRLKK